MSQWHACHNYIPVIGNNGFHASGKVCYSVGNRISHKVLSINIDVTIDSVQLI